MHPKEKKRLALHREQLHELADVRNLIEKEKKLKRGGHHKISSHLSGSFMKKGIPHSEVDGGSLTNLHIPSKGMKSKIGKLPKIEKGLSMKKQHYHTGGYSMRKHDDKVKVYKKGGHHKMHHDSEHHGHRSYSHHRNHHMDHHDGHHRHHMMRRAHGGTIYEHEMVGEHPSHQFHHYNYEGMMRGEHPIHTPDHYSHGGHHRYHERHEHHGRHKYAAGGVGKIRHEQASSKGMPTHHPSCKVRIY